MIKKTGIFENIRFIIYMAFTSKLWYVIFIIILKIILNQKEVLISMLVAQIFNNLQIIVEGNHIDLLLHKTIICAVMIFALDLLQWLLSTVSDLIENYWREYVYTKLQCMFLEKDYKCDLSIYDDSSLIDKKAISKSVDLVNIIIKTTELVSYVFALLSFSIILWKCNCILFFVAILIKIPTIFLYKKTMLLNKKFRINSTSITREKNYFHCIPIERANAKEYKIYNIKNFVIEKYTECSDKYLMLYKKFYLKKAFFNSLLAHYDSIIKIIAEIIIGLSVFRGKILFGTFTLTITAFNNLSSGIEKVLDYYSQLKNMLENVTSLQEYLCEKSIFEKGEMANTYVESNIHELEFKKVCFSYPGTDKPVLENFDMKIEVGRIYGLVGLNGSGKSTLVNLILRLYEPDSGVILLDGINIQNINIHSYYKLISCVFQTTSRLSMSVYDYVSSGNHCETDKVNKYLNIVKLNDWVSKLPHGINTMLTREFTSDNDSIEPSGGIWQKLSIARALYKESPLLILDEPSASLDVETEYEIFKYVTNQMVNKTALLISHRLSNVIDCDCIFFIKNGKIVEHGTHDELIKIGREYSNLFKKQSSFYRLD